MRRLLTPLIASLLLISCQDKESEVVAQPEAKKSYELQVVGETLLLSIDGEQYKTWNYSVFGDQIVLHDSILSQQVGKEPTSKEEKHGIRFENLRNTPVSEEERAPTTSDDAFKR